MKQKIIDSDRLFSKLMENSPAGITLLDANFNIIYRSSSVRLINGSKDENRSKALMDLVHPSDRQMLHTSLDEILATDGLSQTCTFRALHADGHYIWLECICTNMLHEPLIEAIVFNFIDITHTKQVEESLHQTINELYAYKYALDQSAIVAITDQKGTIKHVNNNFCRISKYTTEELIGQDHRIINSAHHDKAFIKNLWYTIANGKTWRGEIKNKAKDRSFYWVDTTIVPFLNEEGKPYQYLAIRSDITKRKQSEERLIALNQSLQEQNKKLTEISWIQSHVIRAPLAKIMGLIPLVLEQREDNDEKEKLLRFLKLSADELDDVIKNINSITQISPE
jgi:PAS domain S-box-containing protein